MYAELAAVLRPGGLLLDGDHFTLDAKARSPVLARLDQALRPARGRAAASLGGHPENWHDWWDPAAAADPALVRPRRRAGPPAGGWRPVTTCRR